MAERVSFRSTSGPMLAGLVDAPLGTVRGWGVFSHGFSLGKDCPAASRICKQLAHEGIGMLRFDNLGLGQWEGDWGDGSFLNKVASSSSTSTVTTSQDTARYPWWNTTLQSGAEYPAPFAGYSGGVRRDLYVDGIPHAPKYGLTKRPSETGPTSPRLPSKYGE